jgi:hypothetical protein
MLRRIVCLLCCIVMSDCAVGGVRVVAPLTASGVGDRAIHMAPDYEMKNGVVFVSSENDDIILLYQLEGTNFNPIGSIVVGVSPRLG